MKKSWMMFIITAFLIGGCSNSEEQVLEQEDSEPVEEEEIIEVPTAFYPFTGLATDEEEVNHRVIGVTINNHPAARPQSGLSDADVVYEILSEYEVTRLVALFHSQLPERVGPVRSARPYHIDLVNGYEGILVHHGGSPEARERVARGEINSLDGMVYDGSLFKRSSERKAPHNSYITTENIIEGITSLHYETVADVQPLPFSQDGELNVEGLEAKDIEINYYNINRVRYQFDEQSGMYHRFNGDDQTIDYETNQPVELSNLFVVETAHQVLDDKGRRAIDLTSGGRAILFMNGIASEINWENRDGQIVPVKDGELVLLKPGQTWINVVPTTPGMEETVTY
ncbi:DUF3048 domain-containing protein [Halalkalibacter akibai]|uniref:Lipoprotein YerB n=1 Tax=Halalkalibacter akibai (strain ATCC 43226 / DSM 21942 / CIP 109018 / JCM 9157 / 1139) TaxID=1236973 RepID=W4QX80_HALA3|nr:DUF3048 domain-containing protein [Halalkalibacter akibai]GAE36258.1 hypothetical protein JCM9157_3417 [Halalkalibacter akibai JCM 9157]